MFSDSRHSYILTPPRPENINNTIYVDGNAYLHELCRQQASPEKIRTAVLELGADPGLQNKHGLTALGVAVAAGNLQAVHCLLDLGSDMFFPLGKNRNFNALLLAIDAGKDDIARALLERGAGVHVNKSGITAEGKDDGLPCLHIAVRMSRLSLIRPLTEAGALVDQEAGPDKLTPLMLAARNNLDLPLARLISCGANIDAEQSGCGMTALHYAVMADRYIAAKRLLDAGADPDALTETGQTPLMLAAHIGSTTLVRLLLEHAPDINARRTTGDGETALMRAAAKGQPDVVEMLLKAGADPLLTDVFNKTAAKYAEPAIGGRIYAMLKDAEDSATQRYFENKYRGFKP